MFYCIVRRSMSKLKLECPLFVKILTLERPRNLDTAKSGVIYL